MKSKWTRPATTTAVSSSVVKVFDESKGSEYQEVPVDSLPFEETCLPLLTSNCPGWICFAEKTHPQAIPYLSTVKSPQQVLGVLIKKMLQEAKPSLWNTFDSSSIFLPAQKKPYVVSIQPCFDKKLEASRLVSNRRETIFHIYMIVSLCLVDRISSIVRPRARTST